MGNWFALILLSVSQFIMVLDSTVMNVSISTVAADLGTDISGMQAAITFYALTMAAFMLTGGKLGDRWGRSARVPDRIRRLRHRLADDGAEPEPHRPA